jgi:hypothetical protein
MNQSNITTEELHKEIDLVQECITRMAQNSFAIKGWAVGIVTALIALSAERIELWALCLISIGILVVFWALDAFFLKMEKCYRFKYEWIIEVRLIGNHDKLYDLNPYNTATRKADRKTPSVISVMFSKPCTLLLFYGFPLTVALIVLGLSLGNVI